MISDAINQLPRRKRRAICLAASLLLSMPPLSCPADFQGSTHMVPFDEEPIGYTKAKAEDCVTRLQKEIDAGKSTLAFDPEFGYLKSALRQLKLNPASQVLVFSKTSFQRDRISPHNPRALYFNDEAWIGYVPGSPLLEVAAQDPKLGTVFYTLDQRKMDRPQFVRNDQCLECHASSKSMGVPGLILRSLNTDEEGVPDLSTAASEVNHRTPLEERWGGWYVTGQNGRQSHRGNLFGKAEFARHEKSPDYLANLGSAERFFPKESHLSPRSDIVALMVMEHQSHLQNFITRLNFEAEIGLKLYGHIKYTKSISEAFLKYLLFTEEAPLANAIKGNAEFAKAFEAQGKKDSKGRSLRQFDLQTRLFKYPCSYLIYSEAFEKMPKEIKTVLYTRLWEILSGKDAGAEFQKIPAQTKKDILEILAATKTDLPPVWQESLRAASRAEPSLAGGK